MIHGIIIPPDYQTAMKMTITSCYYSPPPVANMYISTQPLRHHGPDKTTPIHTLAHSIKIIKKLKSRNQLEEQD